jgi:hypothetical protein
MLVHSLKRMSDEKRENHIQNANLFIDSKLDAV